MWPVLVASHLCWAPWGQESHTGHRTHGVGEPSWEGSALSRSLTSSEQVASDAGHLAMELWGAAGQGDGVGVPGAAGCAGEGNHSGGWAPGTPGVPESRGWGSDSVSGHSSPVLFAVGTAGVQLGVCSWVSPMQEVSSSVPPTHHF